jgi:uncharacterized protein YecE (DUF72 family)
LHILTGTSGYSYKEWKGHFYPADLKADAMLAYYAERLKVVEINNTFYRMPKESVLLAWAAQVPEDFTFVLKASRRITHIKRLKEVGEEVRYLFQTANILGPKLGPTLFQLPPNLKKDLPRLTGFLALIPETGRAAMEFRHESWFDEETYAALRAHDVALVYSDEDEEKEAPFVSTASWGYLRLRRGSYDLAAWATRIAAQPWSDAFVFFKHEEAGAGPKMAAEFAALVPNP